MALNSVIYKNIFVAPISDKIPKKKIKQKFLVPVINYIHCSFTVHHIAYWFLFSSLHQSKLVASGDVKQSLSMGTLVLQS